ncbi:MAG TPA: F0F1 ATP synthase subunit B [Vicinamibacteria bacterium]|nr:F0F1 ATP synthase subunit B [Vicinamibacteria bacterium]
MVTANAAQLILAASGAGGGGLLSVDATLLWATLVIFAVFAAVLGRFAWGPLLKIVDEREKQIRDQLESAERAAAEARELLAKHQELLKNAGRERDEILARAMKEADALRAELVAKARAEGELAIARAKEQIQRESEQAILQLRGQVADLAIAAASRIVQSSLTEDAQRRLVDEYIHELPRVQ